MEKFKTFIITENTKDDAETLQHKLDFNSGILASMIKFDKEHVSLSKVISKMEKGYIEWEEARSLFNLYSAQYLWKKNPEHEKKFNKYLSKVK